MILPGHDDTRWERVAGFEWTEKAFEYLERGSLKAEVRLRDGVVSTRVWGNCPRCGGLLDDRQVHTAVTNVLGGSRGMNTSSKSEPTVVPVDITCGCGRAHDGSPDEQTGCGVSFRVELEAVDHNRLLRSTGETPDNAGDADPAGAAS